MPARPPPDPSRASFVTEGPVGRAVLRLAWPVVLVEAVYTLFHIVDMVWVGRLGAWATAAVSASMFALWTIFSLANLVAVGLTAQVSRSVGAGDMHRAGRCAAQGFLFSVVLGSAVAGGMFLFAEQLFLAIGGSGEVVRAGTVYLKIFAAGTPFFFVSVSLGAAMRAAGDTRTPMSITALALVANAVLDPFLIYGWGPFPRMGVAGAALATAVTQAAGALAFVRLAFKGHPALPFDASSLPRVNGRIVLGQARIGAPHSLVGILFSINYLLFAAAGSRFGDAAVAVIGISNRLESITYLGADGFAVAAATLVGQNLGAGRPDRAERSAWIAGGIMSAAAAVFTVVLLAFPAALFGLFTADPHVITIGVGYLRILAVCQVATAIEGVIGGAFAGAGDTVPPMVVHMFFALARPPLAFALAHGTGMGMDGIALTITATCLVRAVILVSIFRMGRWKSRKLPGESTAILPSEDSPEMIL